MITKAKVIRLLGEGFTTRQRVASVMGYKDPHSADKLLQGLDKVCKNRYLSSDVADVIMSTLENER